MMFITGLQLQVDFCVRLRIHARQRVRAVSMLLNLSSSWFISSCAHHLITVITFALTWLQSIKRTLFSRCQILSIAGMLLISSIDGHRYLRPARRGHELDCQHREDARSVMLGTLFLSVSTTMHCLCLTLGTGSNSSTSRPTSTLTAFEDYYRLLLHKLQRQTTDSQLRNASLYSALYTANSKLKQPTYVQASSSSFPIMHIPQSWVMQLIQYHIQLCNTRYRCDWCRIPGDKRS